MGDQYGSALANIYTSVVSLRFSDLSAAATHIPLMKQNTEDYDGNSLLFGNAKEEMGNSATNLVKGTKLNDRERKKLGSHLMAKQRRLRRRLEELSEAGHDSSKNEHDASDETILQGGGRICEMVAEDFLSLFTLQLNRQWGLWHNTLKSSRIHRYKTGT